jgi:hypothetical protein
MLSRTVGRGGEWLSISDQPLSFYHYAPVVGLEEATATRDERDEAIRKWAEAEVQRIFAAWVAQAAKETAVVQ